jgi:hypothetical protein
MDKISLGTNLFTHICTINIFGFNANKSALPLQYMTNWYIYLSNRVLVILS